MTCDVGVFNSGSSLDLTLTGLASTLRGLLTLAFTPTLIRTQPLTP